LKPPNTPPFFLGFLVQPVAAVMEGLMARQPGLFDRDERHAALSAAGDPLYDGPVRGYVPSR
jgi:hypothetical protein